MNRSLRPRTGLWSRAVTIISLVGVAVRAIAGELVVDLVGSSLGNFIVLVLVGALAVSLASFAINWWIRTHRSPPTPVPGEEQPAAGVVEDLPNVAGFVGRDDALRFATSQSDGAAAIVGRRGVGTSACVKKAALELAGQRDATGQPFPDGTHYLNLRVGNRPLPPEQVVAALARRFGSAVPSSGDASEVDRCAQKLRERLAAAPGTDDSSGGPGRRERRALLVLDNVDDPAQIEPLLPFPRQCRVLLAGCTDLARHEGVTGVGDYWWLGVPTPGEAAAMFRSATRAAGDRDRRPEPGREPAVRRLIELCGRMPRPVRALGYRMALHRWPADELIESLRRLVTAPAHQEVLYVEALDLVADQDVAYAALSPGARRLYRRLALAPGPLEPVAVAALYRPALLAALPWPRRPAKWAHDRAVGRASRLVDELASAGLVESPRGGCRIRDRFAPYAHMHLRRDEPVRSRVRAELRLVRHLARDAERHAARLTTAGTRPSRRRRIDGSGRDPATWFELHHRTLRRLVTRAAGGPGVSPQVQPRRLRHWWFRVAVALCTWYAATDSSRDWEWTCTKVLGTPTAGDRWRITSWAHNELGVIHRRRGDLAQAHVMLANALRERGHRGEAQVLTNVGLVLLDKGDRLSVDDAIWNLRVAARHRSPGDRAGMARSNLCLGLANYARGDLRRAAARLWEAVQGFDGLDDRRSAAAARSNLGLVYWQLGERQEAWETLEHAVRDYERLEQTTYDKLVDRAGEAAALLNLGAALIASEWSLVGAQGGEDAARRRHAERAYSLLESGRALRSPEVPTPGLGRTHLYLGDAAHLLGRPDADENWRQAARICAAAGDPAGAAAASQRLLVAWLSSGDSLCPGPRRAAPSRG